MHFCQEHQHFYYKECRYCVNEKLAQARVDRPKTCHYCKFYDRTVSNGCDNSNWGTGRPHFAHKPICNMDGRLLSYERKENTK